MEAFIPGVKATESVVHDHEVRAIASKVGDKRGYDPLSKYLATVRNNKPLGTNHLKHQSPWLPATSITPPSRCVANSPPCPKAPSGDRCSRTSSPSADTPRKELKQGRSIFSSGEGFLVKRNESASFITERRVLVS